MVTEALGSFIVVFFYISQTEEKTVFSQEKVITCFIIAASYISARSMCAANAVTKSGSVLNPAIAIGTILTMLFSGDVEGIKWIWLYGAFPLLGAIVAVIFHEFVFKKT